MGGDARGAKIACPLLIAVSCRAPDAETWATKLGILLQLYFPALVAAES